jgi:hypothetical protein
VSLPVCDVLGFSAFSGLSESEPSLSLSPPPPPPRSSGMFFKHFFRVL